MEAQSPFRPFRIFIKQASGRTRIPATPLMNPGGANRGDDADEHVAPRLGGAAVSRGVRERGGGRMRARHEDVVYQRRDQLRAKCEGALRR